MSFERTLAHGVHFAAVKCERCHLHKLVPPRFPDSDCPVIWDWAINGRSELSLGRLAQRGTRDIVGSSCPRGTSANEPAESSHHDEGDDCVDRGGIEESDSFGRTFR